MPPATRIVGDMCFGERQLRAVTGLIALALVGTAACGGREEGPARDAGSSAGQPASTELATGVTVDAPSGWQLLRESIDAVVYPEQVLAAASYLVEPGEPPSRGCHSRRVLDQKPPDGVLLQVIEWTKHAGRPDKLTRFPRRRAPFRLPPRACASYECAGPSYNVAFRDQGRAFQAFVWLDPDRVDPRARGQAVELLTSMRFARPPLER